MSTEMEKVVVHLTEIFAFLPLADVVTALMVFRHKLSNPGFFPSDDHKRKLLACMLGQKPMSWRRHSAQYVLTATQPLTLNALRMFVNYSKVIPLEAARTDLLLNDFVAVGQYMSILVHSPSGMQLRIPCSVCPEKEPGSDDVCGTFVFDRCTLCEETRHECENCCGTCDGFGTFSAEGVSHLVCKDCMLTDNMCAFCGFVCAECFKAVPALDGCYVCSGPLAGGGCPNDIGPRCWDCRGNIMWCTTCHRTYCGGCCEIIFDAATMSLTCANCLPANLL